MDVRGHICREHPKFVFICLDPNCLKAYITWSGLNKHKSKHLDPGKDDYPVCCLFCEQSFKTEDLCDEHICAGKLNATKKAAKQEEQNGSMKVSGDGDEPTVIKEEPQPEQKLPENKTVDSAKKKLKTPPALMRMLRGGSRNNLCY